jgi:hypothetical protein
MQILALLSPDLHRKSVVPIVQSLTAVQSSKLQRSMTTPRYRFAASRTDVFFSADDRQEYLESVISIGFETGAGFPSRVSDE